MVASPNDLAQLLMDLDISWEKLLRDRAAARPGTTLRSELDIAYLKILPTIVAISQAVSDQEINNLVLTANSIFKQRESGL